MAFNIILLVLVAIIPVTILGANLSNWVLILFGFIYLLIKDIGSFNRKFFISALGLTAWSLFIVAMHGWKIDQIGSMGSYIVIPLYYLVFKSIRANTNENEIEKSIDIMLKAAAAVVIFYIGYLGIYYNVRIYGNIGYANSYSLLMLILININSKYKEDKFSNVLNVVYITAMLFTGSRTSLILLLVNIIYLEFRKSKLLLSEALIASLIVFALLEVVPILGILAIPMVLYLLFEFKGFKNKKIPWVIVLVIIAAFTGLSKINTFERVGNIASSNGSLQERLLTFEDSIKNINILGHGINTYEYEQFKFQSGFYDIKYIHDSILHTTYELGVLGGIALLSIVICGVIILYKERKFDELVLVLIVFFHSLLDFDFVFLSIIILLLLFITFEKSYLNQLEKQKSKTSIKEMKNTRDAKALQSLEGHKHASSGVSRVRLRYRIVTFCLMIFSLIVIFDEGILRISYLSIIHQQFYISKDITKINPFNDWRIDESRSDAYVKDTTNIPSKKEYEIAKGALINGLQANNENIILKWDLAYVFEKLQDPRGKDLRLQLVEDEKYYFESYKEAYKYCKEDKQAMDKLKTIYENAYNSRNDRTQYLKNQLKNSFDATLKMKYTN